MTLFNVLYDPKIKSIIALFYRTYDRVFRVHKERLESVNFKKLKEFGKELLMCAIHEVTAYLIHSIKFVANALFRNTLKTHAQTHIIFIPQIPQP